MKKSKLSEEQIVKILHEATSGQTSQVGRCRKHDIGQKTFCFWKRKYAGMETDDVRRLKELEAWNAADQAFEVKANGKLMRKNGIGLRAQVAGRFHEQGRTLDFFHYTCLSGTNLKILAVVDVFTRECPALVASTSIKAPKVRSLLANPFATCGEPKHLRNNNGPMFVAHSLTVWLAMAGAQSRFKKAGSL